MTMQQLEIEPKTYRAKKRGKNLSLPMIFSIGLHLLLVGGLVYASTQQEPPKRLDVDEGMSVVMLDLAGSAEPQAEPAVEIVEETVVETEPEVVPEPEVIPEPEPEIIPEPEVIPEPEPEIIPEPEVIPEPIVGPKIVIPEKKVEPKPLPKPKPKPKKSADKPVAKPAATVANNNVNNTASLSQSAGTSNTSGGKPLSRAKPTYPERARSMGVEGQVKVKFDVDSAGKVQNIQIVSETPKNMFGRDVRRAMLRWRYEVNKPVKNLQTTFVFNLSGKIDMK